MDRIAALDTLAKYLNTSDDLMEIAFGLGVQDALNESVAPRVLARELISCCEARGKLAQLAEVCMTKRPDVGVDWRDLFATDTTQPVSPQSLPQSSPQPQPQIQPFQPSPQVPTVIGTWNVSMNSWPIGTTALYPDGTLLGSFFNGQATGRWAFNPATSILQTSGWMNGMPFAGGLAIQQWLPDGFIALGLGDGAQYRYSRTP